MSITRKTEIVTLAIILIMAVPTLALPWLVPDTGQTTSYTDTYGEDSDYTINTPSYTKLDASGNELPDEATEWVMVRDNVTGLIWEVKTDDGSIHDKDNTYTWQNAQDVFISQLNTSNFGGYSDWHLPNMKELHSLINYARCDPAIDTDYFPNTLPSYYWSSTTNPALSSYAWLVDFSIGSDIYYWYPAETNIYYVRAVRGGETEVTGYLVDNGDGTVTDTSTGLMWQQSTAPETYTWEEGISYSQNLSLAGYDDWRLPNIRELHSLVDYERNEPSIDTGYFSDAVSAPYWSSTSYSKYNDYAWYLEMTYGQVVNKYWPSKDHNVRSVRGGQFQIDGNLFITSPVQASSWDVATTMPITWETQEITGNVKITLSRDGGKSYETIRESNENNGSYTWTVTGPISNNCVLRIEPLSIPEKGTSQGLFTIANTNPNTPSSPTPSDAAIGISIEAILSWTGGDPNPGDTVTYDIYFGTDTTPTTIVSSDQSPLSFSPGPLTFSTTYYWKVVARDNHGAETTGPNWSFTCAAEDDSDLDGMSDNWEIANFGGLDHDGTVDTDLDGLMDLEEYQNGTDPNDEDSDNDGMPDGWEMDNGLNPISDDAVEDPDGDRFTNKEEYQGQTDPNDSSSFPVFDENYVFERMWPTLQQPWYFNNPGFVTIDSKGYIYVSDVSNNYVRKFTSDGRFVSNIGAPGWFGDGQFYYPFGVAVDDSGYIYIVDRGNDRIQKLTTDGEFITKWGSNGTGEGQFDIPCAVAVDKSGYVYITDQFNNRVQKFTSDGQFVTKWGSQGTGDGQFDDPYGIAIDSAGDIYVVDQGNNRVQKFTSDGNFILKWAYTVPNEGLLNSPRGIAVDGNDYVYVTDYQYGLQKYTPDGQFVAIWGGPAWGDPDNRLSDPKGLAVDKEGYAYIVDGGGILKITIEGLYISRWESKGDREGQFDGPSGITMGTDGYIYIADLGNDRVQKTTTNGHSILKWGTPGTGDGQFDHAEDITMDSNGNIYVCEWGNHRIQSFTSGGVFVSAWGTRGTGEGELDYPHAIATYNDGSNEYIYIVDAHDRVQKFTVGGQFLSTWGITGSGDGQFDGAGGIAVNKDGYVYVTDSGNSRVQMFDSNGEFVTKWGSYDYGMDGQGKFSANIDCIAVDEQGYVYVSDSNQNANLYRIQKFGPRGGFITQWGASGYEPGLFNHIGGMCVDSDGLLYALERTHNRIQVFKRVTTPSSAKAIVVAGGGSYPGNNLWDATQMSANFAYRTLTYQGFTKESIYYLSSNTDLDLDSNGEADDVDGDASNANLQNAVINWASDAENLVLYLVDHGGDGMFRMSGTEILNVSELDSWLDQRQIDETVLCKVIVIYDACESGSFLTSLTPPTEKERIVITSTSPGESAYFVTQGSVSFSNYFWTCIFNGLDIRGAFELAVDAIGQTTTYQHPLLDADGNGIENELDDFTSVQNDYIGNGTIIYGDAPAIGSVSATPQNISGTNSSALSASDVADDDGIVRVWAVIRPPDYNQGSSDNPVQELPSIDLMSVGNGQYEATYDGFNTEGIYQIVIYARDTIGNTSIPLLTTVTVNDPLTRKAIVVAGGDVTDPLWPAVENIVKLVYDALSFQAYSTDDIYLISPASIPGVTKLPVLNTLSNVEYAISTWAQQSTQDVVLYMVGNGGSGTFDLNSSETLSASQLDSWLDILQTNISGKVTVIYDASYSGSFLLSLVPPYEKERILISGSSGSQSSHFISDGDISFSKFFWRHVLNGMNVRDSFVYAKNAIYYCAGQSPQLDDNGNGIGNQKRDGLISRYYSIGVGIMLAGDDPVIGSVSSGQTLYGDTSATIWAEDITTTGTIDKVWAVISPPAYLSGYSDTDLPTLELVDDGNGHYEGTYSDFSIYGNYIIAVYAMDTDGNVSFPKDTYVFQEIGPDLYEDDDTLNDAGVIIIDHEEAQRHNFHDEGDEDWVKFYGIVGETYDIKTENLDANCDTVIMLYDENGDFILDEPYDLWFEGEDEILSWECPADGVYYVMVEQYEYDPPVFGQDTGYDLTIYQPVGGLPGWLMGIVVNSLGQGIGDTVITSGSSLQGAMTNEIGFYKIRLPSGIHTIYVDAPGYDPQSQSGVEVLADDYTIQDFLVTSANDIDNDGVNNETDNCPDTYNPEQTDSDGDETGDECDECPNDPNKIDPGICGCGVADTDSDIDGTADCLDTDDDDDGMPDEWEELNGLDPLVDDADEDPDHDGYTNLQEYQAGTNPNDPEEEEFPWEIFYPAFTGRK